MTRAIVVLVALVALSGPTMPAGLTAQGTRPTTTSAGDLAKASATKTAAAPGPLSFAGMDRNADGRVSEEEFRNALAFVFAGQDANHDDVVTRAEVEHHGPAAVKAFEAFDTAKAGRIDLDAFLEFGLNVFRGADTDGDGFVTVAERDALRAKVKAERATQKR